jgi:branched-chain amino acid transport system ATP-binding protein
MSVLMEINGLTAGYGGAAVLRSVDLKIDHGEIVAMLGANGAGKTTTLRVASGLLRPMMGTAVVLGQRTDQVSAQALARAGLAHVPEGRGLFYGLTVAEHFRLGYRGERLDMDHAFDYFPALKELRNRRAGLLSGGEQQMLAVARALARRPKLLLLDELSLGLAPVIVQRLLPIVQQFARDNATGVLLVEQHVHLALDIADRAIVLTHGEISLEDRADVLRRDRHLLAASYLGAAAD